MKAIVIATEAVKGLLPVCGTGCGAGTPLLGRPMLFWTALAMKRAGADSLVAALPEGAALPEQAVLPAAARRFPAGTGWAEILLACAGELEGEEFLLADGRALWDLDLGPALADHRRSGRTAVLVRPAAPAAREGKVVPFPDGAVEDSGAVGIFSSAVFPLLAAEAPLFDQLNRAGALNMAEAEGSCCMVEDPAALLQASADLLAGKYRLSWGEEPVGTGVWSRSPIPEGVELVPPCFIGAEVTLGRGCLIGPHVCLEDGVSVGKHSLVQRSILHRGTQVGSRATVYGGVVGQGARLGCYTVLNEGTAVGPGALVGDNAILMEGVAVEGGAVVPPSRRLTEAGAPEIQHREEPELTVEDLLRLGRRLGRCGTVGTGGAGFTGALLARAFGCGAAAQGAEVVFHDGTLPEQAAWLARYYRWPASLFADGDGGVYLYDSEGLPLKAPPPDGETGPGGWDLLAGTGAAYEAAREREELPPACTALRRRKGLEFL